MFLIPKCYTILESWDRMQSNGFDRKMIWGDFKKNIFSNPKGGPLCFQKRKSALVGVFLEKNPMTNKIEKFLYILEHLIPDGCDEIPTFALYHPLLILFKFLFVVRRISYSPSPKTNVTTKALDGDWFPLKVVKDTNSPLSTCIP